MVVTGASLKKLRSDAELTQRQLADLVGVSQAHIAKIESERVDPRLSTVNKILHVLTEGKGRKCGDVMTKHVISARPSDTILKVSRVMMKNGISQLPIIEEGKVVGTITEEVIIRNLSSTIADRRINEIMQPPTPIVPEDTNISIVKPLLEDHYSVLVTRKGEIVGIITRSDVLKIISKTL